jgi:membrane-bound metal-dependent hydrolase YbcI (DUF457 family)
MFLGHLGVAMAAKKVAPRASLGTLMLAAQLCDVIWPVLVLAGAEKVAIVPGITAANPLDFVSYPISHSLAAVVLWALALALVYAWRTADRPTAAWLATLVLSHWLLDALSHRPDVPLWPGGPVVGAGLWNSVPATLVVEFGLYAAGVAIYLSVARPRDRMGAWLFWTFVLLLATLYLGATLGPPPPSVQALAASSLLGVAFIAWAYWIDRHREVAAAAPA